MITKRTLRYFKKAVANESKHYPSLRKYKGVFNDVFIKSSFDSKQSPRECCNSMTETT